LASRRGRYSGVGRIYLRTVKHVECTLIDALGGRGPGARRKWRHGRGRSACVFCIRWKQGFFSLPEDALGFIWIGNRDVGKDIDISVGSG
jgi:hypothetical protein